MLRDPNLKYMNKRCNDYCLTVICDKCKIGEALTAATGEHHRCGNGHHFVSEDMSEEEIFIAYHAIDWRKLEI